MQRATTAGRGWIGIGRTLACLALTLLGGCALLGGGQTVNVTTQQAGTRVRLAPGDVLAVTLPSGGGDQFTWAPFSHDERVLSVDDEPEMLLPMRNDRPDRWAQAFERHTFRAESVGETDLILGPPGADPAAGDLTGRAFRLGILVE